MPKAENGRVPVYEWTVDWALRDDEKPILGSLITYNSFAAAQEAALKKLANRGKKTGGWTDIKFVQITGTATDADVNDLDPKRAKVWKAIQAGIDKKAEACNFLVRDIAAAAGVKGLADKTADEMWGYFRTAAEKDGWKTVTGETAKGEMPTVSAIEAANRLAADGYLVVGVLSKDLLNKYKKEGRKDYGEGHVFVVAPTDGVDWKSTLTANAVKGDPPTPAEFTPATDVVASGHRPVYEFYAIPLSKK